MRHAHVIGAGVAGLAAALALADSGWRVLLYDAAPAAGGRCRSYFDRELGCRIDNGNHLLLSGNHATNRYLRQIGAHDTLTGPSEPLFPFIDIPSGRRWTVRPNRGRLPWWILGQSRRVPGTRAKDYLALLALRRAGPDSTVADMLPDNALWKNLLEPLAVAALNTPPASASAQLLWRVIDESLARGGAACIPRFPRDGLSESFIDPALARLKLQRASFSPGRRIAALRLEDSKIDALLTADGPIELEDGDRVVLAVPAPVAAGLIPGLTTPTEFQPILNVHFLAQPAARSAAGFFGVIGGTAEWIFEKPGVASVTISAANTMIDWPAERIAAAVWPDVRATLALPAPMPRFRVVKERRATFSATPSQEKNRPRNVTSLQNLFLAGDWIATALPATIEGAIRSGRSAATALIAGAGQS